MIEVTDNYIGVLFCIKISSSGSSERSSYYKLHKLVVIIIYTSKNTSSSVFLVLYQGRIREEGMQLAISPTCEQKLNGRSNVTGKVQ